MLAADLSYRCPAFATLRVYQDGNVALMRKISVDNHKATKKGHGEILSEIHHAMESVYGDIFVRERGFSRFANEVQTLFRVVGVTELYAWEKYRQEFYELSPMTVKQLITGNGKADKEEVARHLEAYLGPQEYATDDESDVCAVGLAFLIQNGFIQQKSIAKEQTNEQ